MKSTKSTSIATTSSKQKRSGKDPRSKRRKNIDDRDLNGEEGQRTNNYREEEVDAQKEESLSPSILESDTSVEDEQDREVKRRLEDAHPDELLK